LIHAINSRHALLVRLLTANRWEIAFSDPLNNATLVLRKNSRLEGLGCRLSFWLYAARGYLMLANQFERNGCKHIGAAGG